MFYEFRSWPDNIYQDNVSGMLDVWKEKVKEITSASALPVMLKCKCVKKWCFVDGTAVESECLLVNKNMCEEPSKKIKKHSRLACTGLTTWKKKNSKMHLSSLAHDGNEAPLNAFIFRQLNTCVLFIYLFLPFNEDRMKPQCVGTVI